MTLLTLYPPMGFNQPGERDNNEDAVFPPLDQVSLLTRLFLVCDGVGGGVKGEVASRITGEAIAAYFATNPGPSDDETVAQALRAAEGALDAYVATDPDAAGMATTLTLLHLYDDGATVAHVGDSRVICCRAGDIRFATDDHKLVNEWVKQGILTPEQARDHPQQNLITRAVRGSAKPAQADVALLKNALPDDYFFLCTDGVLENLTPAILGKILKQDGSDADKVAAIRLVCDGKTQDNYSAYLVHIQTVGTAEPAEEKPAPPTAAAHSLLREPAETAEPIHPL